MDKPCDIPGNHPYRMIDAAIPLKRILIAAIVMSALHIAMGADPFAVMFILFTILLGLYPVSRYGILNIGGLLILLVTFRHIGFPLLGKILFLQPVDSNLDQPLGTVIVIFTGILSYLIGFFLIEKLDIKKTILKPTTDTYKLNFISVGSMIIGCIANFSLATHAGKDYTGITVANFFVPFLHLALITAVAAVICRSNGRRYWNFWVLAIMMTEIAFAFVRNSRMALVEIVLCFVLTISSFQKQIKWVRIGLSAVFAFLVVICITPVMLYVRAGRSDLTWTRRISATVSVISDWQTAFHSYTSIQQLQNIEGFYLNYYGSPQNVLERLSFINHVDVMKTAIDKHEFIGLQDLKTAFYRSLPRAIAPDKPVGYSQGDWLYCLANVECFDSNYSTVPLIANGYAAFGWFGAFLYPVLMSSLILLTVKVATGFSLKRNVWGLYLFLRLHNCFVEGGSASYFQTVLRDLPQDLLILTLLSLIVQIKSLGRHQKDPGRSN